MTQTANNYGTVLFELGIPKETVEDAKRVFRLTRELPRVLSCPAVSKKEKHRVIALFFPAEIQNFLKELCDHGHADLLEEVFTAYGQRCDEQNQLLRAVMYYALLPDAAQLAQIKAYLAEKYHKTTVVLELKEQPELIGGFLLRVGDREEDFSIRGKMRKLEQKLTWR